MKQKGKIYYRSIFKYSTHQDSMKYEQIGDRIIDNHHEIIRFFVDGNKIEIDISDQILLTNGIATLRLVKDKRIENQYQSEYGALLITSELLSYKKTKDTHKLKYRLYDGNHLLSEVYVLIQFIEMRN